MREEELFLRISPERFHFLKFILEGYDNLAILSSNDMRQGIVRLRYLSSSRLELFELLSSLATQLSGKWRNALPVEAPYPYRCI